jgi:endoglucanase
MNPGGFMKLRYFALIPLLLTVTSSAFAINIESPKANSVHNASVALMQLTGTCQLGTPVKVSATDVSNRSTPITWTACQGTGFYATPFDISQLKVGKIQVKVYQTIRNRDVVASLVIIKQAVATPTPSPTVVPSPSPTVVPSPSPTVVPSPSPTVVPTANIPMGFTGHEGWSSYTLDGTEARFKFMADNNMRIYRTGHVQLDAMDFAGFDKLVALAKKYNITLRPGILKTTQAQAYQIAKRYANDIKVWEVGNELDMFPADAAKNIAIMATTYKGIKQASDELGANLKTTITIMACNIEDTSATARCPGDKNGVTWFLDQAKAGGFNFDYIGFHYYPHFGDKGYWMDMYLYQMRFMATKFKTKIFYNELNCGEVYTGTTDGGKPGDKGCYDSVNQILTILNRDYKDVVQEINLYELQDEPTHQVEHEKHFGFLFSMGNPKLVFNVLKSFAK